ncbi:MAG: glycoside hydrolase [Planctomycetaceae bacterium]|jgi:predicted neuraminidase|nr:glycoside hydrolase [Planctomycetaceae bacterium]
MKHLVFLCLTFSLFGLSGFLNAQEKGDSLVPATVLRPVPEKYGDEKRQFQGIPSMTIAPNGRLWATWYTGGITEGDENIVLLATSGDSGKTWTKPILAIDIPGPVRAYDPSMWTDPEGNVRLFWAQSFHHWDGRAGVWCITTNSGDQENAVWSKPQRLCDGILMNKPIADSKNRWLLPVAIWNHDVVHPDKTIPVGSSVIVSEDKGKTWNLLGNTVVPKKEASCDENMVVERKDGSLFMWIRTRYGIGESNSFDNGKTWSEPARCGIPHTASRFFIRRLQSGNLLLVKHGGILQQTKRSHLTAMLSDDDGRTWKGGLMLDERNGVSYPDGDQTKDGTIFVIYDFDRTGAKEILMARFTEEDVLAEKIVAPNSELRILVNKATGVSPSQKSQTLDFNPNNDGKPFQSGDSPKLELKDAEQGEFKTGVKLFTNRDYTLHQYPKELNGKTFVRTTMEGVTVTVRSSGILYVLTPLPNRNKDNVTETLLKSGFEKVALPETQLFDTIVGNIVTLYQKEVQEGERIKLGKWSVIVY